MVSLANYSLIRENDVNGLNANTGKVFREDRLALQGAEITITSNGVRNIWAENGEYVFEK
jgi:hypothetical protein